jgi:hypothetical protein
MTDDIFEPEHVEDALRRELHGQVVPFDPARAEEMIFAATSAEVRRLPRVAAPLGTAAAVLAVGAGVAVFAANGTGGGNPAPAGGGPQPTSTVKPRQVCVVLRQDHASATPIPDLPAHQQARLARRKERLAHQAMRKELRKAQRRRVASVGSGSAPAKPLPTRVSAQPARLPPSSIANIKCKAARQFVCRRSTPAQECITLVRPGHGTLQPSAPGLPKITSTATVQPPVHSRARPRATHSAASYPPPAPGTATASPSCSEPPNMPPCPSSR